MEWSGVERSLLAAVRSVASCAGSNVRGTERSEGAEQMCLE